MENEDLRSRLQKLDPAASGVEIKSVDEDSSQKMLESIMSQSAGSERLRPAWYLVGAAAVAMVAFGAVTLLGGGSTPDVAATLDEDAIELTVGSEDALASCLAITPELVRAVPLAFAGTVTAVDGDRATLTVDEWFVGGDAATANLLAPSGFEALIGGIYFEEGKSYLVSAYDGVVNYCGFSGEDTPELRAIYDEAFAG
ncbi:MAG: hypothetical protein ACFCU2_03925 [Acidimicrobiia bacterium]